MPDKKPRISGKLDEALRLIAYGECEYLKDAADTAGVSREHLSRSLNKPHVQERMRELIRQRANTLGIATGLQTLQQLARSASNEDLRRIAAQDLMALGALPVPPAHGQSSGGAGQLPNGGTQLVINVVSHHPDSGLKGAIPGSTQSAKAEALEIAAPSQPMRSLAEGESDGEGG